MGVGLGVGLGLGLGVGLSLGFRLGLSRGLGVGLGSQHYLLHEVVVAAIVEDGLRRARAILHALHRDLEALPLVLQLHLG